MRIDQKYTAIIAALDENNHLQLSGETLHNGLRHTVDNKETVLQALRSLDTFSWCNVPQDLMRDLDVMQNPEDANVFQNMQQVLMNFSNENLMEAPPLEVLKEAVAEYSDEMFEVMIACERMSENFRLAQKTAELAETLVVEGQIKEYVMGGSLVFGVEFSEMAEHIWAASIWLMRKMVKSIQSGDWIGIRAAADHGRVSEAERNAAFREGIAAVFGTEIGRSLEPLGDRKGDALHLAIEMHKLTVEGCEFEYSSKILRTNKISIDGLSLEIDVAPVSQKDAAACMEEAQAIWDSIQASGQRQLSEAKDSGDMGATDSGDPDQTND